MKHVFFLFLTLIIFAGLIFSSCEEAGAGGGGGGSGDVTFDNATDPGQKVAITVGSETVNMVYANNSISNVVIPMREGDDQTGNVSTKFFASETEVTNGVYAAVLQWAYDQGKFSETNSYIGSTKAVYHNQEILDFTFMCHIDYSDGNLTMDSGYGDHPVTQVSWFGAIMFCNWLTEMRDGSGVDTNKVYTGIDNDWEHDETTEDTSNSGYRLLSTEEWEFAARYLGTMAPSAGDDLDAEYVALGHNDGSISGSLTTGYYWTPGDYASGATADHNDSTACQAVAVYNYDGSSPYSDTEPVMSLGSSSANYLGIYDMSGNVKEWTFTPYSTNGRIARSSSFESSNVLIQIGDLSACDVAGGYDTRYLGFRFARTQ